jgi:hypothetical protein
MGTGPFPVTGASPAKKHDPHETKSSMRTPPAQERWDLAACLDFPEDIEAFRTKRRFALRVAARNAAGSSRERDNGIAWHQQRGALSKAAWNAHMLWPNFDIDTLNLLA